MRICVINEYFYPDSTGGTGAVMSDLVRHLTDMYPDVQIDAITSTYLYRNTETPLSETEDWDGIKIYRVPATHPNTLSIAGRLLTNLAFTFRSLFKLLSLGKYDLVLVGTNPPMVAFAAAVCKLLTGTPFAYIVYDLEPDRSVTLRLFGKNHPFVAMYKFGQGFWLNAASRIIALGSCMKDYLLEAYRLPASKIDVIHIGANENDIVPGSRCSKFRSTHAIDGFVVLYTGNFGRYHNFDTILDSAKLIASKGTDIQFVLVGAGAQKERIVARVADEEITNVRIFDFVPMTEYSDLLATADASLVTLEPGMEGLCLPSKFYNILASGRPVIGIISPKSDVSLVINEVKCGFQVDQGDAGKLAEVILSLYANEGLVQKMGQAAREVFVTRFGTNIIAEQYYNTFVSICRNEKSTPKDGALSLRVETETGSRAEKATADSAI